MTAQLTRELDSSQEQVDLKCGYACEIVSSLPRLRLALIVIGCFCLLGCKEPVAKRVSVSGKVLIDQQPLAKGMIRFVPEHGRPTSSSILPDGSFDMASTSLAQNSVQAGVVPGKHRIEISASEIIDEETIRWHAPKKYANFRTSGLEETISKSTDNLVIELTWDGAEGPFVESQEEVPDAEDVTSEPETEPEGPSAESANSNADE